MFYCKNCGHEFSEPEKSYETHMFSDAPFELFYMCPNCKSRNFYEKNLTHCRCCGGRLPKDRVEYCCEACELKGEKLWKKELKRRKKELANPLNMVVKECILYNGENNTNYSYGQYVALIRPKLLKEKTKCVKKRKNI